MPKILVINDSKNRLTPITSSLQNRFPDSAIFTSDSGKSGIETALQELPDLILLDIQKNENNGSEVCQRLKSEVLTRHIPVIMFTSTYANDNSTVSDLDYLADALISHPVKDSELIPLVKTMLRLKKAEDTQHKENDSLDDLIWEKTQALQESELVFSQMFDQSSTATCLYDPDGYMVNVNPEFCSMFGVDEKEITDGRYNVFNDPAALQAGGVPLLRKVFEEKKIRSWEAQFDIDVAAEYAKTQSSKRGQIYLEVFGSPILDCQSNLKFVAVHHYDITQRKQAENALQDSEEKYRNVIQFAIEAICVIQNGMFKFINPEAVKLFGYTEEELKDLPSEETIYPADRNIVTSNRLKRLNGEFVLGTYPHRIVTKEGKILWVEIKAVSITWNQQPAALVFLTDITERKKSEGALHESNERYTALFDRLQDAVYINDLEGNFIDANLAAQNLLGYTKDEIQTLNFASLLDEQQLLQAFNILQQVIETGTQNKPAQFKLKKKNGDFVWVELTSVLTYKNGEPAGVQGIARGISRRKEVEKQLKLAKEQAEAASLTKSQFLTNMSHELRTPMQGILGYARLGMQRFNALSKEKVLNYFQEIHSSGHRLMNLLNALLDLSKLESGKTEYKFTREKISQVIVTIINEIKAITQEKEITIGFQEPEFDDRLIIDKEKIFQVIRNLLSNAVKFSNPKTKIRIDIVKKREHLMISIIDNGIGIPADELETVFDKFTQSSNTRNGAGGTGLGLAICQEIVKAHEGKIWAENNTAGGTTINFELPFL